MRTAAVMPPLTSGSWSGAGTATVLKGSRQVGVSTDSHPEVLLHSFQTFTWVCPARGPWLQRNGALLPLVQRCQHSRKNPGGGGALFAWGSHTQGN